MNVRVLQVDRCKPILGVDAFDNAPARQHLERELVQAQFETRWSRIGCWPSWPLDQRRNRTNDSPPGPPPGEGAALFSPSPEKEQTPTSPGRPRQGRFVDFLDDLGSGWDAGGRRSPARGSTRRPRCWFSLGQSSSGGRRRAPTATGRLRPGPGGSGGWCITQDVLDLLGLLLYRRELLGKALDGVAGASRKRALSTYFISARLSQRWRSWTTMVDIAFPRDHAVTFVARRVKSVAVRSSCINPGSVLPSCTCFSWSAQGNRWWEELRWSHRYANHEQIRDERLVEISTLLIHSAPKQKSNQWTHLSPFYTRIHGEWLRYAKSTSQFHWRFLLVRDDRGFQVNPLCRHDITRSDRQIWNSHSLVRYTSLLILKILSFLISS